MPKRVKYARAENTVVRQSFKSCTSMECPNLARLFWLLTFFVLDHKKDFYSVDHACHHSVLVGSPWFHPTLQSFP